MANDTVPDPNDHVPAHDLDDLELQLDWLIERYGSSRVLTALSDLFADRAEHIAATGFASMAKDYLAMSVAIEAIHVPKGH